jgi:hypothetical protein
MSDMFEYLEAQAQEEGLPFKSAAVVAIDRAERQFSAFLSSSKGEKEFEARVALLQDDIIRIASDVCEEYGYDDPAHIARLVVGQMQVAAGGTDPTKGLAEHQQLPTQDPKGYYTQQSGPPMNPASAGDNNGNTVPSIPELTPDESQNPTDKGWPYDGALPEQERMDMSRGKAKSSAMMEDSWVSEDEDEEDAVTPFHHPKDWLDTEDDEIEGLDEAAPDGGMGNRNRDKTQGDPDVDDVHSDKDLHSQRWKSEHDDQNWKSYRDQQYKPAMAKSAAERMNLDNLTSVMRPSEAVKFLVNEGMPYHEAQTRVDEYVNHLNPGWASKHWKANYEINPVEMNDEVSAGVDDVELGNAVYGPPSAENAENIYREVAYSGSFPSNEFVQKLTELWTQRYPSMDPQEIQRMVQEGTGLAAGSYRSSNRRLSTDRLARLIRYAAQWGEYNTVQFDLQDMDPNDQNMINTDLYEGVLIPFDEMWNLESQLESMGYDLDSIAYVQSVDNPSPNQMVLQFDASGNPSTVPFGDLNQGPQIKAEQQNRMVAPSVQADEGVYMANTKTAGENLDKRMKKTDSIIDRLLGNAESEDEDSEIPMDDLGGGVDIVPQDKERRIHKQIRKSEQPEDSSESKFRGIAENSGFRVRREAPSEGKPSKPRQKPDVKLWTGTVNKIMGSIHNPEK